jgi:hypothetical protein
MTEQHNREMHWSTANMLQKSKTELSTVPTRIITIDLQNIYSTFYMAHFFFCYCYRFLVDSGFWRIYIHYVPARNPQIRDS